MARFTKIPVDTFQNLQVNAGYFTRTVNFTTGEVGDPIMATTGGVSFATNPTFTDFGEDVDNCPKNSKELKRIESYDPVLSGTAVTIDESLAKMFIGAADATGLLGPSQQTYKVTPRMNIDADNDFSDLYLVGDYSDNNDETAGGGIVIHLKNSFNTAGYQWTTTDRGKGQFAFEFHGHSSVAKQEEVPFDIYIIEPATPSSNSSSTTGGASVRSSKVKEGAVTNAENI